MANIKSAKKRILVQAKREAQNKAFRTNLKTVIKRANAAIAANAEDKDVLVKAAVKKIDQACAKGIIHKTAQLERNPLWFLWQNSFPAFEIRFEAK